MDSRAAFEAWFFDGVPDAGRVRDNEYDIAFNGWKAATERAAKVCDEHASIEGIAQACAAAIRKG